MKKTILTLSLVFLFASTLVFTGCKKDDTSATPAPTPTPTITLNSDPGFSAANATVATGASVKIGFVAVPVSGSKLTAYKYTYAYDGGAAVSIVDSSGLSLTSLARQYTKTTRTVAGTETYTFTVTDKNGQTASSSVTFTVKGAGAISTQTTKLIGSQGSASGSFYSTTGAGMVYKEIDAKNNVAAIDFAYYYGATNKASIASVDDPTVSTGTNAVYPNTAAWTPKNATKLTLSTMSVADFNAITDDSKLSALVTPTTSIVANLALNNVVAFETATHKKGLFLVTALNPTSTGDITITVKVQQ